MALLKFLKGNYANLSNATITEGQILVCGDTGELFVDVAADKRVKIGDFITVANLTALEALDATKVPTSRLYYVEDGNILARSNGTTWVQVNKQKTAAEMKEFLGLGSLAYKSEVAEGDLNADLAAKINTVAQGNHSHSNKDVIDGITADKVSAWDSAEQNAKDYADTELAKKVDKAEGYSLVSDTEIERLSKVDNYDDTALAGRVKAIEDDYLKAEDKYDDTALAGRVTTAEGKITALETASATHALKSEVEAVDAKFADYNTTVAQKTIDDAQDARIKAIEDDYVVANDIANFETKENVKKVADDLAAYVESNDAAVANRYTKEEADGKFALIADAYDDEEVRGLISDNADAIAAEKERAEAAEAGLQTQINTIMNNPDAEGAINSINEFTKYVEEHGTIADGMRTDINTNKEDIAAVNKALDDHEALAAETYETKTDAAQKLTDAKAYTDAEVAKDRARLDTLEAIDHDAYKTADATLKGELQAEIDADVKVVNDALEEYKTSNDAEVVKKANSADVYAKTETYNKTEIEALLTWGEF